MSMRKQARIGNKHHGKECVHGHGTLRYVATDRCVECGRLDNEKKNRKRAKTATKYMRERRKRDPRIALLAGARQRARQKDIKFDLFRDEFEIPDVCPVLGIPLEPNTGKKRFHAGSPSLDRINPKKGYVRDNVRVISYRANHLKGDATLEELEAVVADARRIGAGRVR